MSMLSEILATKRTEVEYLRAKVSLPLLQERLIDAPPTRDFRAALASASGTAIIAEVKKASPSKGIIRADFDPLEIARIYAANGAACLSVLTDEKYFQGKLQYLREIRDIVSLPLLRKDFIIDPWQILESRAAGADAILLIVAALAPKDLRYFLQVAQQYSLAALVEVHDREELEEALDAGADLIGINNRDLHTFRTTLTTTLDLLQTLPHAPNRLIVSESGIFTRADITQLAEAGVDAVLIGEALMSVPDIGAKLRELRGASSVPAAP
ncbi:MAG TPA: indole-3-glycerol phosphate synthase TrpC [Chthonomonadaceae bacterium]|nr:indole-3-glycerol phosphate synthase TrpC [Chthonomonadaceae bacterium]